MVIENLKQPVQNSNHLLILQDAILNDCSWSVGDIFGVSVGTFVGKFFVYIKTVDEEMHFMLLPDVQIEKLTKDKFTTGIRNNVLEYQETLPEEITTYCKEQYEKKLNN